MQSIPLLTATNSLKDHASILGYVPLQGILDAPQSSCPHACTTRQNHQLKSVCQTHTSTMARPSGQQRFLHAILEEHQSIKVLLLFNGLGCNIDCTMADVLPPHLKIFGAKLLLLKYPTDSLLSKNSQRNM